MKYLKKFEANFFSDLSNKPGEERKNFDRKIIEQLILDLTDVGFSIVLNDPNHKNMMRPHLSIIYTPNQESATPFKLGDIKEVLISINDYMKSEGYFIDVDAIGPNFKTFRKIDTPKDPKDWDDKQELVLINIYFDCDVMSTRPYEHLKTYNLFESVDDYENIIRDILVELEDDGLEVKIEKKDDIIEINIKRPFGSPARVITGAPTPPGGKYPGDLFLWFEINDSIIRLNEWFYTYSENDYTPGINSEIYRELSKMGIKYNSNSPFRLFNGRVEFGIGWNKPSDFDGLGDYFSFENLKIEIRI